MTQTPGTPEPHPEPSQPEPNWTPEQKPEVGVGPWEGEWPEGGHWDPDLLADGDRRNVVDKYRYWKHEAIVADLDAKRHDFHIAI
ncbi:MAG TPA: rRNA methyltransferase, partial [Arthrobacter sp.]|nr:rRNA methyltransferase [Arthrobacter sp.]